ncbi:hypothetical protein KJ991_01905 [Patescibacteria group bacterium]|nr:hypothetical protein [Patescibacteria group bacterium]MBU4057653.1 hypothetical protein [Patescibacteria group bacterium]MBU4115947.1 hypothetical protein [Patescibacteria group bacterium]
MDKISKFLKKLSKKEREEISAILEDVLKGTFKNLNIKKLTSYENVFRVRKNNIRVTFVKENAIIRVISIKRKNEKTYKNL